MENPLLPILCAAKQAVAAAPQTAAEHLREARTVLSSHATPGALVSKPVLELLSRLSNFADFAVVSELQSLYSLMTGVVAKADAPLQIDLANEVLLLADRYKGSELAHHLAHSGLEMLVSLLKSGRITADQRLSIQSIVSKAPRTDLERKLATIESELKVGNLFSLHRLVDFLSSSGSLREQLDLFGTKVFAVLNGLQGRSEPDMLMTLFKLVDQIVFPSYHSVRLPDHSSPTLYANCAAGLLADNENCFYSALAALKILTKGGMTKPLVHLLRRLWCVYPTQRSSLYEITAGVLGALAEEKSSGLREYAAAFLYWLRHSGEVEAEFRTTVDRVQGIDELTRLKEYCADALLLRPGAEAACDLSSLQVFAGYPIAAVVPPGERFAHVVDIPEPGCILFWAFATEYGDVSYSITLLSQCSEAAIKSESRVQADSFPVIGSCVLSAAGFARFQWDNSFSWFREKQLRYRVTVLRPVKTEAAPAHFAAPIEVVCDCSDTGEPNACYQEPGADIVEVGIHVSGGVARLKCKDLQRTVSSSSLQEAAAALLSEALNQMPNPPKHKKLGIVAKHTEHRHGFEDFGTVAVARDVDALALMWQKSLKTVHTLIAVVQEDGLRSAVVYRGKLLVSEEGEALGDLSRLNAKTLAEGLALLLNSFGPATVVLHASGTALAEVCEAVKPLVPQQVWQHCSIREGGSDCLLEAACRLNLLHHVFQASF